MDLARRGARVILACRNPMKAAPAVKEIREKSGNPDVVFRKLDMADVDSIRSFAKRFLEEELRLDVLVNNAGGSYRPTSYTLPRYRFRVTSCCAFAFCQPFNSECAKYRPSQKNKTKQKNKKQKQKQKQNKTTQKQQKKKKKKKQEQDKTINKQTKNRACILPACTQPRWHGTTNHSQLPTIRSYLVEVLAWAHRPTKLNNLCMFWKTNNEQTNSIGPNLSYQNTTALVGLLSRR